MVSHYYQDQRAYIVWMLHKPQNAKHGYIHIMALRLVTKGKVPDNIRSHVSGLFLPVILLEDGHMWEVPKKPRTKLLEMESDDVLYTFILTLQKHYLDKTKRNPVISS